LTVPIAYTFSNIFIKRDLPHINPIAFTATSALIAGLLTLPFAIANFTFHQPEHIYKSLGAILILGILMSGVALALFYHVIQQSGPLIASLTNYIVPIFALFWGWFDGERTTSLQILGITGIFIMIYITQPPTKKITPVI
jgi:drug/metabolite transporter (DMT)-like permease